MHHLDLITVFFLLIICSFCNSNEEEKEKYCIDSIKSSSLLLKTKKNFLIALETYQPKFGFWSAEGRNNGKLEDKKIGIM